MPTAPDSTGDEGSVTESERASEQSAITIAPRTCRAYLAYLSEHMSSVSSTELGMGPSLFAPNTHWSASEKETFFHALSVHSRLRPDLIADAVHTKNVAEVCTYIDMLEEGFAASHLGSTKGKGNRKDRERQIRPLRDEFPIAYEVDDGWIAREEVLAQAVTEEESHMLVDAKEKRREQEVHDRRKGVRARKRRKVEGGRDKDRDREGEKERRAQFEAWLAERRAEWEVRDVIDTLDGTMLRAMDALLREDEEICATLESEGTGNTTSAHIANGGLDEDKGHKLVEDTSSRHLLLPQLVPFDEELIDPVLRGLSLTSGSPLPNASATPHRPDISVAPIMSVFDTNIPMEGETALTSHPSTFLNPHTPPFPVIPLRLQGEADTSLPSSDPTTSDHRTTTSSRMSTESSALLLSPRARRRLAKRLHMRRKRAVARGEVADMSAARLKPGRKPKPRPKNRADNDDDAAEDDGDAEEDKVDESRDGERRTRHPHPSGKTLPYKVRERLATMGIGVEWLQQEGLDFFHLSAISKLMQMYNNLQDAEPGVNIQISGDTIRLLLAHAVHFTTQLVRKAIVSREQEIAAKMHTKVWRLAANQVVTVANVQHAMSMLGVEVADKRTHFQRLLHAVQQQRNNESDDDGDDNPELDSNPEDEPGDTHDVSDTDVTDQNPLSSLPLHRLVFPPFVRLPASLQPSHADPSTQSLFTHIPWTQTSSAGTPNGDEGLLTSETDEEALAAELQEEEELDARDRDLEASHERELWVHFGENSLGGGTRLGKRKRGSDTDDDDEGEDHDEDEGEYEDDIRSMKTDDIDADEDVVDHKARSSLRFREPGGRVKSTVYIEDSD